MQFEKLLVLIGVKAVGNFASLFGATKINTFEEKRPKVLVKCAMEWLFCSGVRIQAGRRVTLITKD